MKLHIQDDEGKTTVVPLVRDEISIGRKEGNTIRLTDKNVSRQHAKLVRQDGAVFIEEMRSRYGTKVNGERIKARVALNPGDIIQIGDYLLRYQAEDVAAASAPTAPSAAARAPTDDAARQVVTRDADGRTALVNLEELNLDASDDVVDIPKGKQATVVTISNNVQRREYKLTRSRFVIGRSDENDIGIDHRSLSRKHASITCDNGTYTVRDLDSSNGVKVNGDLYKKTDLHSGDEIELGHVKFKFFGPGEAIPAGMVGPSGELPIGSVSSGGSKKWVLFGGAAAILGAGAAVMFYVNSKNTTDKPVKKDEPTIAADATPKPAEPAPAAKPTPPEPVKKLPEAKPAEPTPPVQPPPPQVKPPEPTPPVEAIKPADKPPEAVVKPVDVKPEDPKPADVKPVDIKPEDPKPEDVKPAANDGEAKKLLAQAKAAAGNEQWDKAFGLAGAGLKAGKGTPSEAELRSLQTQARVKLAERDVGKAETAAKAQKWPDVIKAAKSALMFEPGNARAKQLVAEATDKLKKDKEVVKPEDPPAPGGSKLDKAKALFEEGKQALMGGNQDGAAAKFRECLATSNGMHDCRVKLIGILMSKNRCKALDEMRKYNKLNPGGGKKAEYERLIEQFEPQCGGG